MRTPRILIDGARYHVSARAHRGEMIFDTESMGLLEVVPSGDRGSFQGFWGVWPNIYMYFCMSMPILSQRVLFTNQRTGIMAGPTSRFMVLLVLLMSPPKKFWDTDVD
jgi:hypothetical protein